MTSSYRTGGGDIARTYMTIAGVVLVALGLLGFVNIIAGDPARNSGVILHTDAIHNIVHLATGAIALFIAFGLPRERQLSGVLAFAVLYLIILVAVYISPTLFGLFSVAANLPLHIIHAALVLAALATYYLAKNARAGGTVATR